MKRISKNFYPLSAPPRDAAIGLVRLYQKVISPLFPPSCRFYPSCSEYSIGAFHRYGFLKGLLLSVWRVLRCNPFSKGGYDPVGGTETAEEGK